MPDISSPLTQAILAELQKLSKEVSDEVKARSKARKTLADLIQGIESNDLDSLVKALGSKSEQLVTFYPQVKPTLEKLQVDVKRRLDEQARQLSIQLQEYCQTEGIPLRGSPPRFIADQFMEVEFDHKANRVKVGIQSLNTLKWDLIRDALANERIRLWKRPFDVQEFRNRLIAIHRELEGFKPSPNGWQTLDEIYQLLKQRAEHADPGWKKGGRLVAYYKDEFGVDLSKLWQAQASQTVAPPHIELSAVRDPRKAYKVLRPDRNLDEYGFLRIQEA